MADRLQAFSINAPFQGIVRNYPAYLIPNSAIYDCSNVRFVRGMAEKVKGYNKFWSTPLTGELQYLEHYFLNSGNDKLVAITTSNAYYWDTVSNSFINITGTALSGVLDNPVVADVAFNKLYFTNFLDFPKYWDGSTATIDNVPCLCGTPTASIEGGYSTCKARIVKGFQNFVIVASTVEDGNDFPQRLRWCQYGDPTKWKNETDGSGMAGFIDFRDGQDWIVALTSIQNYLVIFKERSIYIASFIGSPFVFQTQKVADNIGALSVKSIVSLGDRVIFIGPDNFYEFNGTNLNPIGDSIKLDFFGAVNPQAIDQVYAFQVQEDEEIWFCYPDTSHSSPNTAYIYNYVQRTWGKRDLPMSCAGHYWNTGTKTWADLTQPIYTYDIYWDKRTLVSESPLNLVGDTNGYVYKISDILDNADGYDIDGWLLSKLYDMGNSAIIKRLQRIQFLISREGSYNLSVSVYTSDNVNDTPVLNGPYSFSLKDTSSPFLDLDLSARYFQIKIETQLQGQPWSLEGMVLYYVPRGPF